jgi:hypothetical protein
MIKLKILDWGKLKQEVDFVGYNADHTVCYIYDENHAKHSLISTEKKLWAGGIGSPFIKTGICKDGNGTKFIPTFSRVCRKQATVKFVSPCSKPKGCISKATTTQHTRSAFLNYWKSVRRRG